MPSQTQKKKLADKVDGDTLDLSVSQLTDAPVDDIAALPRAIKLDLSNNYLTYLPDNFCTLKHLVRLDLSKNQLEELPLNFGDLKNLTQLDLYANNISRLPASFARLKKLKWLDLKDNPSLVVPIQEAAGPCITAQECCLAARKVVALMQEIDAKYQLELQKAESERLEIIRMEEELKKEEKKARKEQRRKELNEMAMMKKENDHHDEISDEKTNNEDEEISTKVRKSERSFISSNLFYIILVAFLSIYLASLWTYSNGGQNLLKFDTIKIHTKQMLKDLKSVMREWIIRPVCAYLRVLLTRPAIFLEHTFPGIYEYVVTFFGVIFGVFSDPDEAVTLKRC